MKRFGSEALLLVAALTLGCSPKPVLPRADGEHEPGAHGGLVVSLGRDDYHAEAVFEKGGTLSVYMLGRDETRVLEVDSQTLTAFAKAEGDTEAVRFTLDPEPQPGDASGKTSRFVGRLPDGVAGRRAEVTVPAVRIRGGRYRMAFRPPEAERMPENVLTGEEERKLYLTPGGKYTAADIEANGTTTPSRKFAGVKAKHDFNPRPGDKLCPVTRTKADPRFAWVVAGEAYEFCCPPCIDEFVARAKEKPEGVGRPDDYRKR